MRQIQSVIKGDVHDNEQLNGLLNVKNGKLSVIKDKLVGELFVG